MSWTCDKCGYGQNRLSDLNCLNCGNPFTFTFKSGPGASSAARASASFSMFPAASSSFGSPASGSYVPGAASASMFPPAPASTYVPGAAASPSFSSFSSPTYVPPRSASMFPVPGAASMFPFGSPGAASAPPFCPPKDKAYFVAESQKVRGTCRITPELEEMFLRAKLIPTDRLLLSEEQPFTRDMFGYGARIRDGFDSLTPNQQYVLSVSNFGLNQAYMGKSSDADEQAKAAEMGRIFEVIRDKRFETQKFGIVYRSWSNGIDDSTDVCGGDLGRYTSTSVRKNYSDWWGTEVPGSTKPNDDAFFATIIIPPNTTSIIPLLLFGDAVTSGPHIGKPDRSDPMILKTKQYEVLLHPRGRFIDTGYTDTSGYRIMVYLGPEKSALFGAPLTAILALDDGRGTNVKGLIESVAISRPGNSAYHAGRKRKTRRYKRSKRNTKK